MGLWVDVLRHDPVPALLGAGVPAIGYFARRDLLDEPAPPRSEMWRAPDLQRALRRQLPTGTWPARPRPRRPENPAGWGLVEAYRHLRVLVDQYQLDRSQPAVQSAIEFVFTNQTPEGDIRGILANQYAPYYTGALLGLAAKAGYAQDDRVEKGIAWLLSMRQADGGWAPGSPGLVALPPHTMRYLWDVVSDPGVPPIRCFDRARPFSAAATGMVLRAFAAHPIWRTSEPARVAGQLLKSKLLRRDNWSSYGHPDNWVRFGFPFWWTDLVSALDVLARLGFAASDPDVQRGLAWLVAHQEPDGLWKASYSSIHKATSQTGRDQLRAWISLAICRALKSLVEGPRQTASP